VKLSYAESFVDAPYWYRYNSLPSYRGARTLTPEQMRSVQLSGSVTLFDERLRGSLNLFYNNLFNFIFRDNNAAPTEPIYKNAGYLQSAGAEAEASWIDSWLHVRLVGAFQAAVAGKDYGTRGGQIYNVPNWSGALSVDVAPVPSWKDKLWLHADVRYTGGQLSPVNLTFRDPMGNTLASFVEPDRRIEGAAIVDLGFRLKNLPVKNVFLQGQIYNLFDTFYEAGGSTVHPYPQQGRWFLVTIGYTLEP
jgi:iron complex outermembrane receptor protein